MIHVCSLARLHDTVATHRASHIVTLLRNTAQAKRPDSVLEKNHLVLSLDDIAMPIDGYLAPDEAHVTRLIAFARDWDRKAPMVVHCFAGISRSTAAAFVTACTLNPQRDEQDIAWQIRKASGTATPNARIVALADDILARDGRMVRAVEKIGAGDLAEEGVPFRLDLE